MASGDTSGKSRLLCATVVCLHLLRLGVITERHGMPNKGDLKRGTVRPRRAEPSAMLFAVRTVTTMVPKRSAKGGQRCLYEVQLLSSDLTRLATAVDVHITVKVASSLCLTPVCTQQVSFRAKDTMEAFAMRLTRKLCNALPFRKALGCRRFDRERMRPCAGTAKTSVTCCMLRALMCAICTAILCRQGLHRVDLQSA